MSFRRLIALVAFVVTPQISLAQAASTAFGNGNQDTSQPVEVTADNLSIDQDGGTALYTGNVVVGQGDMRLAAPKVLVIFNEAQNEIVSFEATGGVTLVSGDDAAEAQRAKYFVADGNIVMTGNVLLSQGANAAAAEQMTVNLESGSAELSGRVKTILTPGKN